MFWSIILNFCCKTSFFSFRLRERVKPWMHLKRILVSMFWSINASLPHPRLARACTSTRCSVKQVVGVLVLYYRALADLATTSEVSRDALQKNQCDRRTKKTGGVPSTNPKQWNKKATDIDLSCWDRSIRSNIVFWQSEHLTITPWNVSLVFEVTAIYFLPLQVDALRITNIIFVFSPTSRQLTDFFL